MLILIKNTDRALNIAHGIKDFIPSSLLVNGDRLNSGIFYLINCCRVCSINLILCTNNIIDLKEMNTNAIVIDCDSEYGFKRDNLSLSFGAADSPKQIVEFIKDFFEHHKLI